MQVNHATADGGTAASLVAGGTVGGVTADLGSVYIAGRLVGDAGPNVITMCSFTGCSVNPPAPTFTLPTGAGAATSLTIGHGQLYGAFGGPPYACTLGTSSSCAPMSVASSNDVAVFLAPGPEGVFYSGKGSERRARRLLRARQRQRQPGTTVPPRFGGRRTRR